MWDFSSHLGIYVSSCVEDCNQAPPLTIALIGDFLLGSIFYHFQHIGMCCNKTFHLFFIYCFNFMKEDPIGTWAKYPRLKIAFGIIFILLLCCTLFGMSKYTGLLSFMLVSYFAIALVTNRTMMRSYYWKLANSSYFKSYNDEEDGGIIWCLASLAAVSLQDKKHVWLKLVISSWIYEDF